MVQPKSIDQKLPVSTPNSVNVFESIPCATVSLTDNDADLIQNLKVQQTGHHVVVMLGIVLILAHMKKCECVIIGVRLFGWVAACLSVPLGMAQTLTLHLPWTLEM